MCSDHLKAKMRVVNNLKPGLSVTNTPPTPCKLSPRAMPGVELSILKSKCRQKRLEQLFQLTTFSKSSSCRESEPESLTSISSCDSGPDDIKVSLSMLNNIGFVVC